MGKEISSRNAFKHGHYSRKNPPNPAGDPRFNRIRRAYRNHLRPGDPEALALTDNLAYARWLKDLVLYALPGIAPVSFARLYAHYDRVFHRAWNDLARAIRLRTPAPGQLPAGFFVRRANCGNEPEHSTDSKGISVNAPAQDQTLSDNRKRPSPPKNSAPLPDAAGSGAGRRPEQNCFETRGGAEVPRGLKRAVPRRQARGPIGWER